MSYIFRKSAVTKHFHNPLCFCTSCIILLAILFIQPKPDVFIQLACVIVFICHSVYLSLIPKWFHFCKHAHFSVSSSCEAPQSPSNFVILFSGHSLFSLWTLERSYCLVYHAIQVCSKLLLVRYSPCYCCLYRGDYHTMIPISCVIFFVEIFTFDINCIIN